MSNKLYTLSDGGKIYGHKKLKRHLWIVLGELKKFPGLTDTECRRILENKAIKKTKINNRWYIWKEDLDKVANCISR